MLMIFTMHLAGRRHNCLPNPPPDFSSISYCESAERLNVICVPLESWIFRLLPLRTALLSPEAEPANETPGIFETGCVANAIEEECPKEAEWLSAFAVPNPEAVALLPRE